MLATAANVVGTAILAVETRSGGALSLAVDVLAPEGRRAFPAMVLPDPAYLDDVVVGTTVFGVKSLDGKDRLEHLWCLPEAAPSERKWEHSEECNCLTDPKGRHEA